MQAEFSRLLKKARKEKGLTQKELADLLGVATGTVQQWELSVRFPRVAMLKKIEDELKISIVPSDIKKQKKEQRKREINAAWKAAEKKAGRKLSFDEAMEYFKFDVATYMKLEDALRKLNNDGVRVALERVEELTLIDKYTLPVVDGLPDYFDAEQYEIAPTDNFTNPEGKDTDNEKKPSESEKTPSDGK